MIYDSDELLLLARTFAAEKGCALSTIGFRICRNDRLFPGLAEGKRCRIDTAQQAGRWFQENWPEGVRWPLPQ